MSISAISGSSFSMSSISEMFQRPKVPEGMEGVEPGSDEFFDKITSKMISDNDTDGDGALSASEIDLDEDMFNSIDSDGDGLLTKSELTADAKKMHEKMMAQMQSMQASNGGSLMDMLGQSAMGMSLGIKSYSNQQTAMYSLLNQSQDTALSLVA